MREWYLNQIDKHTKLCQEFIMTDIKMYMFHQGELNNYRKMLDVYDKFKG